jgi:hypothetical protein
MTTEHQTKGRPTYAECERLISTGFNNGWLVSDNEGTLFFNPDMISKSDLQAADSYEFHLPGDQFPKFVERPGLGVRKNEEKTPREVTRVAQQSVKRP